MKHHVSRQAYTIQSVDAGISVLKTVAHHPDIRLTALAEKLQETKPRILRMLRTLENCGMVQKMQGGGYRLGIGALVVGTAASTQVDFFRIATRIMEDIGRRVNETVQLRIIDNDEALCIGKFEPTRDLGAYAMVGRRRPLYAGTNKTLLAFLPAELQRKLLPDQLTRLTKNTIVDMSRLFKALDTIRKQGYCISRGEVNEALVSVGVPVLGRDGSLTCALNITAPAFRTQDDDLQRFIVLLQGASRQISRDLGH